jgi:hypothetical protein
MTLPGCRPASSPPLILCVQGIMKGLSCCTLLKAAGARVGQRLAEKRIRIVK